MQISARASCASPCDGILKGSARVVTLLYCFQSMIRPLVDETKVPPEAVSDALKGVYLLLLFVICFSFNAGRYLLVLPPVGERDFNQRAITPASFNMNLSSVYKIVYVVFS